MASGPAAVIGAVCWGHFAGSTSSQWKENTINYSWKTCEYTVEMEKPGHKPLILGNILKEFSMVER